MILSNISIIFYNIIQVLYQNVGNKSLELIIYFYCFFKLHVIVILKV
jgi:hypothetical protein